MKRILMFVVLALMIPVLSSCSKSDTSNQSNSQPEINGTVSEFVDSDIDEALSNGIPTIVQFSVLENPCYKCIAMKVVLDEVKEKYQDKINIVLIDINKNRELATEYEVMLVPTQVFYNTDGNEIFRHSGYMDIEDVLSQLSGMGLE